MEYKIPVTITMEGFVTVDAKNFSEAILFAEKVLDKNQEKALTLNISKCNVNTHTRKD